MKTFDFSGYHLTLIVAPVDGRYGYDRLAAIGRIHCGIDVDNQTDALVFISRRYGVAKVILRDDHGRTMITRWVDVGRFEKFLYRDGEMQKTTLSKDELLSFLDGKRIQKLPQSL